MSSSGLSKKAAKKAANQASQAANQGLLGSNVAKYVAGSAVFIVGFGLWQFVAMINGSGQRAFAGGANLDYLDVANEAAVENALYSGAPHVVYCTDDKTEQLPVPKVIGEIKQKLAKSNTDVQVVHANCFKKMTAGAGKGKTIAEAFKFGKNPGFIGVFANQDEPLQLNYLSSAKTVSEQILPKVRIAPMPITYLKDWDNCKSKRACLVIGAKSQERRLEKLSKMEKDMKAFRSIKFAALDTSFWQIKLPKSFVETRPQADASGGPDPANAMCLFQDGDKAYGKFLPSFDDEYVKQTFLEECRDHAKTEGWIELASYPTISAKSGPAKVVKRPERKLTPEEEAKRREADGTKQGGKERVGRMPDAEDEAAASGEDDGDLDDDDDEEKKEDDDIEEEDL